MIISITRLKLKSIWKLFPFMKYTAASVKQLNNSDCVDFKANLSLTDHYTYSLWNNKDEMRAFSRSGDHAKSVKRARNMAKEIRIFEMEGKEFPGWKKSKALVNEFGKKIEYP